jgi:hypothetical protein
MAYNIDTSKATVPEALEVLADAVLNPKFQSWEVTEQVGDCRRQGRAAPVQAAQAAASQVSWRSRLLPGGGLRWGVCPAGLDACALSCPTPSAQRCLPCSALAVLCPALLCPALLCPCCAPAPVVLLPSAAGPQDGG